MKKKLTKNPLLCQKKVERIEEKLRKKFWSQMPQHVALNISGFLKF